MEKLQGVFCSLALDRSSEGGRGGGSRPLDRGWLDHLGPCMVKSAGAGRNPENVALRRSRKHNTLKEAFSLPFSLSLSLFMYIYIYTHIDTYTCIYIFSLPKDIKISAGVELHQTDQLETESMFQHQVFKASAGPAEKLQPCHMGGK